MDARVSVEEMMKAAEVVSRIDAPVAIQRHEEKYEGRWKIVYKKSGEDEVVVEGLLPRQLIAIVAIIEDLAGITTEEERG